eukprot:11164394-Lingulodinium_polyedra.AAC.1
MRRPTDTAETRAGMRPRSANRDNTPTGRRAARQARYADSELRRAFRRAGEALARERETGPAHTTP